MNTAFHSINLISRSQVFRMLRLAGGWYWLYPYPTRLIPNILKPRQNRRHFTEDIFKCIFLTQNVWILIEISRKFVTKCAIYNIPATVQIMVWRRPGDNQLSEPMLVSLPTHICVTRPQLISIGPTISCPSASDFILKLCKIKHSGSSISSINAKSRHFGNGL